MLRPQDLLVVIRLALKPDEEPTYQALSVELGMSASEVHASIKRASQSALLVAKSRTVNRHNLLEFLLHGVRYAFPAEHSAITRGIPTAHAAPPLASKIASDELPPVWPHSEGTVRGEGIAPLYRSAPDAARKNSELYEWLALVDAVRAGRARERALASKELTKRLEA